MLHFAERQALHLGKHIDGGGDNDDDDNDDDGDDDALPVFGSNGDSSSSSPRRPLDPNPLCPQLFFLGDSRS